MQNKRVEALDYLRGAMALSIMVYHFCAWSNVSITPSSILGRLGIYGVPIFYIISGASLYLAHSNFRLSNVEMYSFYKKRFLRLAPAFWVACFLYLVILKAWKHADAWTILTNVTLSFGFLNYTKGIPAGAWSIGNEVCFYLIFPALIILLRRNSHAAAAFVLGTALLVYFSMFKVMPDTSLSSQWKTYIHPANQVFFFIAGMIIAKIQQNTFSPPRNVFLLPLLAASMVGIVLFSPQSSASQIVSGTNRIVVSLMCVAACYACINMRASGAKMLEIPMKKLGEISYSLYILHGALFSILYTKIYSKHLMLNMSPSSFAFYVVAPLVIILAAISYRFIEKPFIRLGRSKSRPNPVAA